MSTYKVYFSNAGLPGSGLSPTFNSLHNVDDGSSISPTPVISGIGGGWYKFDYTPSGQAVGVIYASGLADTDAYVPVDFSVNDYSLDAAITSRPGIDDIIASGNAANWSGVADISTLATEANATSNKNELLASGVNWTTATGFAVPGDSMNLTSTALSNIVASGNAANWDATATGMLTLSDIYSALGLNSSGLIDEISTLSVNPTIANAIYLSYMSRRNKVDTDKNTGITTIYDSDGNAAFTGTVSDDGTTFTRTELS